MQKDTSRQRDIKFFSKKNNALLVVHSQVARKYAAFLESSSRVQSFECNKKLDMSAYYKLAHIGIRNSYFEQAWTSDFFITTDDGRISIREIVSEEELCKRAIVEKLEFSRRYWVACGIKDWKIIVVKESDDSVY